MLYFYILHQSFSFLQTSTVFVLQSCISLTWKHFVQFINSASLRRKTICFCSISSFFAEWGITCFWENGENMSCVILANLLHLPNLSTSFYLSSLLLEILFKAPGNLPVWKAPYWSKIRSLWFEGFMCSNA